MTITILVAALIMFMKNQGRDYFEKWSNLIDKSFEKQPEDFVRFRDDVFMTLKYTKHSLGDDGFEQIV